MDSEKSTCNPQLCSSRVLREWLKKIQEIQTNFNTSWSNSLHSENCKMGEKARSFAKKEWRTRWRQIENFWLSGKHSWSCLGQEEAGNKYTAQNWLGFWGLTDWICSVSGQDKHVQRHKGHVSSSLLSWQSRQEQLHPGPRKVFQHQRRCFVFAFPHSGVSQDFLFIFGFM